MIDTIVARATPPGPGALAVVRISGPEAFSLRDALAPGLRNAVPRQAKLAALRDPRSDELLDRGVVTSFRGPASYTGEDLVEISCHGGYLIPGLLVECALASGARMAEPGEFTRRAYLNGKMDLLQAEAVGDLVGGCSRALHRVAVHQMERGLSARIAAARAALVKLEALLVHHLDFPDEDEPPTNLEQVAEEARTVSRRLARLLATAPEGELLREGALTVLAGRPNTGKSSIFNALLGFERAIVTEVPGTTRDAIEATVSIGGYPFRLVDTAGLRETGERVEAIGIEVARRYLARADMVLFCVEKSGEMSQEDLDFLGAQSRPVVILRTKADLAESDAPAKNGSGRPDSPGGPKGTRAGGGGTREEPSLHGQISLSVRTGEGLQELGRQLPRMAYQELLAADPDMPILTRARHGRALEQAVEQLDAFARELRQGVPAEMAATHLWPAATALEDILGIVTLDEVLDRVFRDFCIGK